MFANRIDLNRLHRNQQTSFGASVKKKAPHHQAGSFQILLVENII
jgi:hypothetical protein